MLRISNLITDPDLLAAFRSFTQRATTALGSFDSLSGAATGVLGEARRSGTVERINSGMNSLNSLNSLDSLGQVSGSLDRLSGDLSGVGELSQEAGPLLRDLRESGTLSDLDATLVETRKTLLIVGQTTEELRGFLGANRTRLVATLDSIKTTSDRLQTTLATLDPVLTEVQKSQIVANLNAISTNAVRLTENLEKLTAYLGDPATVVILQQLLESSRAAFANLQKIAADVDEVTGNPQIRQELIRLIQGLSRLVSSSEQLQNDVAQGRAMARLAVQIAAITPRRPASPEKPRN